MPRRARSASNLEGFLVIDKQPGMTSHDVVGIVRRQLGERRVGHAGTLDPDASGVLIVAVGRATRLMRFVVGADKAYTGTIVFGTATSTLDASGEVVATFDMGTLALAEVARAATGFVGPSEQIPPMVSAIKVGGKRLYELARAGEEVDRAPRPIEITRLEVRGTCQANEFDFTVECSSGTYVRSLVADVGVALGGGAHLKGLRRTRVGPFDLARAAVAGDVAAEDLRPAAELVAGLDRRELQDQEILGFVLHGRVLDAAVIDAKGSGPFALFSLAGDLVAVYEFVDETSVKPLLVYAGTGEGTAPAGAASAGA